MRRTMFWLPVMVLALAGLGLTVPVWKAAKPGYEWSFPRDLAAHPEYKTEWWYVTGNLEGQGEHAGQELAFQLTFFRIGLDPAGAPEVDSDWAAGDLVMAHASVSDPEGGGHVFSEVLWRAAPLLGGFGAVGDTTLAWCRAPAGTDDIWSIGWDGRSFYLQARDDRQELSYDLKCTPTRDPVFHGDGGYSPKSADGGSASLYFSQTRMEVEGSVRREDEIVQVEGLSWLDREIFTSTLGPQQVGWDWVSLQLDDGRDLMLYRLRDAKGRVDFALGTLVHPDGRTETLVADRWKMEARETWASPETGSEYPVVWMLDIPDAGLELELRALLPDQENVSGRTGVHYWEGAVRATKGGKVVGKGFVELTGYGEGSRPPV